MQARRRLSVLHDVLAASVTGRNGGRAGFRMGDAKFRRVLKVREPWIPPDGLPVSAVRVARYALRWAFIDALPEWVEVRWGVECIGASSSDGNGVLVQFSDGRSTNADFLITADGANSKMRGPLRPNDTVDFAGAVCIVATSRMAEGLTALIREDYGVVAGGDGHGLFVSPVEENSAVWSIGYRTLELQPQIRGEEAVRRKDEILQEALQRGEVFAKSLPSLVKASDPATLMVFNAMDKQPIEHAEMAGSNITLIGDTNHAVSPFTGNGANMALMDGVDLAHAFIESADFASAAAVFDRPSIARSKGAIQQSHFAIRVGHSRGWEWWLWSWIFWVVSVTAA